MLINVSLIRRRLVLWWEETGQYHWENARPSAGCCKIFPFKVRQEASVSWAWVHIDRLSHEGTCYIWNGHIWQQLENILPCNVCIGCLWHVLMIIKSLSVLSYHDYLSLYYFIFVVFYYTFCFYMTSHDEHADMDLVVFIIASMNGLPEKLTKANSQATNPVYI